MAKTYKVPKSCQVRNLGGAYLALFGYRTDGFFVDVGAYDGVKHSNTWALAKAAWSGLCYEPVEEYYGLCRENHKYHPGVKTLNVAVGDKVGTTAFYVSDVYSTYHQEQMRLRKQFYSGAEERMANVTTLDISLAENNIKVGFEVLSIDVEGAEMDVLNGFDISKWQPQMCIIEAHERHPNPEMRFNAPSINAYFWKAKYQKIYSDDTNNIYISPELARRIQ